MRFYDHNKLKGVDMQELNMVGKKKVVGDKTKLLMHLDGNSIDVAGNPVYQEVGVSYMTNQKFGKKAATFTVGGYIDIRKAPLNTLTGDMTVEFIITFPANLGAGIEQIVLSNKPGLFMDFLSGHAGYNGGKPCWLVSLSEANDSSKRITIDAPWVDGLPHHFAMCRRSGTWTFFLDGISKGTMVSAINWDGIATVVGNYTAAPGYGLTKNCMQEFRLSNMCRYVANFTPSATPFVLD